MVTDPQSRAGIVVATLSGSLPERLRALLAEHATGQGDLPFDLDGLSLALGLRLPDQAQTATFWQRGDLGRALRGSGFGVRVELGRVIFVRGTSAAAR